MKKIYYLLMFMFILKHTSFGQLTLPHQSQSPPLNGTSAISRGMYVDCADEIVNDICNGNSLGLQAQLTNYISNNFIDYIVLCGLENANVFGNPNKEFCLRTLIANLRSSVSGIKIGVMGNDAAFFQSTAFLAMTEPIGKTCLPSTGVIKTSKEFSDYINFPSAGAAELKRSELCKFFYKAARFNQESAAVRNNTRCAGAFDVLYLQYRYWDYTSSMAAMKAEYASFKAVLSVMKVLKCNFTCIRNIDAEFFPTDRYKLQAWTAIDQITEIDPLVDRLMIPAFTSSATSVFDVNCKTLHYLSDVYSKPRSQIYLELSAESASFSHCNSSLVPDNYLGDYLNGNVSPSGNMFSVENMFMDKFNNPSYMCNTCSCYPYSDNHYSSTNTQGNVLMGMMWYPYSMLINHNLFKIKNVETNNLENLLPVKTELINLQGKILQSDQHIPPGIYFERKIFSNGTIATKKILLNYEWRNIN